MSVYDDGRKAYRNRRPIGACPHLPVTPDIEPDGYKIDAWLSGWMDAETEAKNQSREYAESLDE